MIGNRHHAPGGTRLALTATLVWSLVSCGSGSTVGTIPPSPLPADSATSFAEQPPSASPPKGFFSAAQAQRGRAVFGTVCGECHALGDFRGRSFEFDWRNRSAWNLFRAMVETMPEDAPGSLTDQTYADVIAYILQLNRYAEGPQDLLPSRESLDAVQLGPGAAKSPESN